MKQISAIIAALIITGVTGLGIFAIGGNAYLNTNTVPIQSSPSNTSLLTTALVTTTQQTPAETAYVGQIKQLQALIAQYQARDQQFQSELTNAAQQLSNATNQAQQNQDQVTQLQSILATLQQRGVIQIDQNGNITIPSPARRGSTNGFGG